MSTGPVSLASRIRIADIAMNGGCILDTARILGIGKNTVIATLKKSSAEVVAVNPYIGSRETAVEIRHLFDSPMDVSRWTSRSYSHQSNNSTSYSKEGQLPHKLLL